MKLNLINIIKYACVFIFIKLAYITLNVLMLPETWISYDFDRNIDLSKIFYELLFLFLTIIPYCYYFRKDHSLTFISTLLFCLYIIPSNCTMTLSGYDFIYYFSLNLFNILLLYFLGKEANKSNSYISYSRNNQFNFINSPRLQKNIRIFSIFTCIGVILYVYFFRGSLSLSGIFNDDIYDRRAIVADLYLQNTDGLIAYLMTFWSAFYSSMLIIGLYISLRNNRKIDVLLCLFTYLVLFSFNTQKTVLFKPIIAIFIYYIVKTNRIKNANMLFLLGYSSLLIFSFVEYYLKQESIVYSVIIRRIDYMPQYLSHAYYEFFSNNNKIWLTRDFFQLEKIVRFFYQGSYDHGAVAIISNNCFPGVPSPNTGLFAEAYAQLGYWGIFIFPPIIAKLLSLLNKNSQFYGVGAAHVLMASLLISIINIQILATRGILIFVVFILITWVLKKSSRTSQYKSKI